MNIALRSKSTAEGGGASRIAEKLTDWLLAEGNIATYFVAHLSSRMKPFQQAFLVVICLRSLRVGPTDIPEGSAWEKSFPAKSTSGFANSRPSTMQFIFMITIMPSLCPRSREPRGWFRLSLPRTIACLRS